MAYRIHLKDKTALITGGTRGIGAAIANTFAQADANIIIGYVSDEEVFLRDDYGIGNVRHGADVDNGGTYDLSDVEGSEAGGVTTVSFTMPLDSGDALDKPLVSGSTYKMLMAHGPDGADDFGTYHGSRGSVEINL